VLLRLAVDADAGRLHGAGQSIGVQRDVVELLADLGEAACPRVKAEVLQHGLDRQLAGHFAGGLPAHTVAYDVDATRSIVAEIVFVIGANAADVASARHLDCSIQHSAFSIQLGLAEC